MLRIFIKIEPFPLAISINYWLFLTGNPRFYLDLLHTFWIFRKILTFPKNFINILDRGLGFPGKPLKTEWKELQTCSTRAASAPNNNNETINDAHPPQTFLPKQKCWMYINIIFDRSLILKKKPTPLRKLLNISRKNKAHEFR